MEWKDYLGELSRRLAAGNSPGETLDILRELDDFHREAAEGGATDEDFIAKLGAPEIAARNLTRDRGTEKAPADWRFWLGVALMALVVLVLRDYMLANSYLGYSVRYYQAMVFCAVPLVPAALWWSFHMKQRVTALAFAAPRREGYGQIAGLALIILMLVYVLGFEYWQTFLFHAEPIRVGYVLRIFSAGITVLATIELIRAALAIYRGRPGGFPACCFWLGLLCTRMLIELPLRSMSAEPWQGGLSIGAVIAVSEIPAILALVLTVGVTLLARSLLRKKVEEVRKAWTHN